MKEKYIKFNYDNILPFIDKKALKGIQKEINIARKTLEERTGLGNDYLGWKDLPNEIDPEMVNDIQATAKKIRKQSNVLVVIGIGG